MANVGMRRETKLGFDEAISRVTEALQAEGFGVLTQIDVKETLKKKLGVDFRKYRILGACNPPLAHRALSAVLEVGVMLPCNVVVYESDAGKATLVAIDPMQAVGAMAPELGEVAREVRAKLARVLERVQSPSP
jgi:uncharacterized protein (DUF302 family)